MTKPKPKPRNAADAVSAALQRERARRGQAMKPIEIVKVAISAYQAHNADAALAFESDDRAGLRRGTQASVDRLLFNVNYWRAAFEDRIVAACPTEEDAAACLHAISAWNTHTMKLNTMGPDEVIATFERFCPPFAVNNRKGSAQRAGVGKGPVPDFRACALALAERVDPERAATLEGIVADVETEAALYGEYAKRTPLDALYDLLPIWCLQDRIELVSGTWWNDARTMGVIARALYERFLEAGHAEALCSYFLDVMNESMDVFQCEISAAETPFARMDVMQLAGIVRDARAANPNSETDGYGAPLPSWLSSKEQLIWNTIVCAVYGPMHARPLLTDSLDLLPLEGKPASTDVITDMAQRAYASYMSTRRASGEQPEFQTFALQPDDLRNSGLERIESIPDMLKVLGYRIVPLASCYPEQRVETLRASEVECLAILEHRRWCAERAAAGWQYAAEKDVSARKSPYLVDWDDLPDRAREWDRASARDIPSLLASVGLAISR